MCPISSCNSRAMFRRSTSWASIRRRDRTSNSSRFGTTSERSRANSASARFRGPDVAGCLRYRNHPSVRYPDRGDGQRDVDQPACPVHPDALEVLDRLPRPQPTHDPGQFVGFVGGEEEANMPADGLGRGPPVEPLGGRVPVVRHLRESSGMASSDDSTMAAKWVTACSVARFARRFPASRTSRSMADWWRCQRARNRSPRPHQRDRRASSPTVSETTINGGPRRRPDNLEAGLDAKAGQAGG